MIDLVHASVQKLQHILVSIDYVPFGLEDDTWALDHYVLLGVRLDTRLVDLFNLIHGFLPEYADPSSELGRLQWESELRVRKCLKLSACVFLVLWVVSAALTSAAPQILRAGRPCFTDVSGTG